MTTTTAPSSTAWHEPDAASPRGWFHAGGNCTGWYLDYGPDHYRSPHAYCRPADLCATCQPGTILACAYPNGPGTAPHASRWFENIDEARAWIEAGGR